MEEKGYTIVFIPWEDDRGRRKVASRFKTAKEKDDFLKKVHDPNSGWLREEISSIQVINDYDYDLPY